MRLLTESWLQSDVLIALKFWEH